MNPHALHVLQYSEALDHVAGHASSPLGAEAVRGPPPSDALVWIETELRRVAQMVAFLLRNEDWVIEALPDLRKPLRMLAADGSVWEGPSLRDAGTLLASARGVRRSVLRSSEDYPLLAEIAASLVKLESEQDRLRRAIDEAGEVRDSASRELSRLRREIRGARRRIVERLE